ncbi:MAG: LptF/LptG family permease, partial [bacterium]
RDISQLNRQIIEIDRQEEGKEALQVRQDELKTSLRYRRVEIVRSLTELHKRFSLAFSCFFFLLFGVPVGLLLRRGGIGTGFIVGLIFFAIYYILLLAGENMAENSKLSPFLGMWLPNLILILPVTELMGRALFEFSALWMLFRGKR